MISSWHFLIISYDFLLSSPVPLVPSSLRSSVTPERYVKEKERSGARWERGRDQPLHTPPFVPRVSCYTVNLFQFPSH